MSAVLLPLFLLIAAYFGSILAEGRTIRGFGLPSGAEWLVLGVILGPHVLGVFETSVIREFQPLVIVGLGWTALVVGIDYGYVGEHRIRWPGLALGLALPALCGAAVAAVAFWVCSHRLLLGESESLITALAMALVSSETTRHAVRWVSERHGASGPLATRLAEIADADDLLPLMGLAVLIALGTESELNIELSVVSRLGLTVSLGAVLGLIAAGLLSRQLAFGESWTVVIGMALLGIGMSMRLGTAALTVLFVAGAVLSMASHRHAELRQMLAPTERAITLPMLLLGGASLDLHRLSPGLVELLLAVLGTRIVLKVASGWLLALGMPSARKSPSATGAALLASGTVTMSIGLYGYLSLDDALGDLILLAASLVTIVGELIGPLSLRRALERAGEVADASEKTPLAAGQKGPA